MEAEFDALILDIRKSIDKAKNRRASLVEEKDMLQEDLVLSNQKLEESEQRIANLEEKNSVLKMAKTIEGDTQGGALKSKINELVREIDKCIALLNK